MNNKFSGGLKRPAEPFLPQTENGVKRRSTSLSLSLS
jgi:hypothetical protein